MSPPTPESRHAPVPAPATGDAGDAAGATAQYLTFSLGDEVFALGIRGVREIIQHGPMTAVPLVPAFVRGVINLRGAVVPVIDLQARLGRAPARVGRKSCVVIVDTGAAGQPGERSEIGLLVDAVSAVVDIAASQVEPPPDFGAPVRREFIQGVARLGGRFVVLLEPARALDLDEMAGLCEAAHQALAA